MFAFVYNSHAPGTVQVVLEVVVLIALTVFLVAAFARSRKNPKR